MPQIWMTYGEIAGLLGCDEGVARTRAAIRSLDRKKSRDGLTRKAGPLLHGAFLCKDPRRGCRP
jgi:hypothetical protein